MSEPDTALRHGEIIETTTVGFVAESDRLHQLPNLGELVQVGIDNQRTIYAVVSFGETGPIDAGRRAVRRSEPNSIGNDVFHKHPELEHILRTVFRAVAVGYVDDGEVHHALPPSPAPLHFGVHPCTVDATGRFCSDPAYLSLLANTVADVPADQLIAAHLRWVDQQLDDDHAWLRRASRRLARLMQRNYDVLLRILESIDPGR